MPGHFWVLLLLVVRGSHSLRWQRLPSAPPTARAKEIHPKKVLRVAYGPFVHRTFSLYLAVAGKPPGMTCDGLPVNPVELVLHPTGTCCFCRASSYKMGLLGDSPSLVGVGMLSQILSVAQRFCETG